MRRKLAVIGVFCLFLIGVGQATVHARAFGPRMYYLSLGTSLAAGIQADPLTGENIITETSYPSVLAETLQATRVPKLSHVNLGCSGETSETFIYGGECTYPRGSQLEQAFKFLHRHRKRTALITMDIGANDVRQCVDGAAVDAECLYAKLDQVTYNLAYILETLQEVAPKVPIVAMNYYNPYLAYYFVDPAAAEQTIQLQMLVNLTLETVYSRYGVPVVDVADAFMSYDLFTDENLNAIPDSLDRLCTWTWMCSHQNIHPNEAGYAMIADLFLGALPDLSVWAPPRKCRAKTKTCKLHRKHCADTQKWMFPRNRRPKNQKW